MKKHQEKMILSSTIDQNHTYKNHLKEFFRLFKCLTSRDIYIIAGKLGFFLSAHHAKREREREIEGEFRMRLADEAIYAVIENTQTSVKHKKNEIR